MRSNIYLLIPLFLCTSEDDEKLRNCHVTHISNYSTHTGIVRWASTCTQLRNSESMSQKSSAVITLCKTLLHLFLKLGYHESRTDNADCITVEAVGRNSLICLNNVYVKRFKELYLGQNPYLLPIIYIIRLKSDLSHFLGTLTIAFFVDIAV